MTLERPADGLVFQAYVKNLFDKTPITDTFTNSDDTGLTANVFTLDPRLVAVSVSKRF
jgi:outer membrane receptor protein involved in Fe transport